MIIFVNAFVRYFILCITTALAIFPLRKTIMASYKHMHGCHYEDKQKRVIELDLASDCPLVSTCN